MSAAVSRVVAFAGSGVRVEGVGRTAAGLIEFLFADLPCRSDRPPCADLRLEADVERGALTLHDNGRLHVRSSSLGDLAAALVGVTISRLSESCDRGLLLHAAAVARDGRCLLLPGRSGVGKTTLAAWLVARGFEYLTDEIVFIPHGSGTVEPFMRPLCVKASAMTVLSARLPGLDTEAVLRGDEVTLVPWRALGRAAASPTVLSAIVFPEYEAGATRVPGPVPGAEAGLQLMGCLINARNLAGHGFREVIGLVRQVSASRLPYGDLEQVDAWIGRWRG